LSDRYARIERVETLLFAEGDLGSVLGATARKPAERLGAWDADALLKAPEADVVEELIEEGTVRCPRLLRDEVWMPPPSETTQKFRNFGEVEERRVIRIVLVVPFDGDRDVFRLRANAFSLNPPRVLTLNDHELRIAVDGQSAMLPAAARDSTCRSTRSRSPWRLRARR
jgi:hypothetical protein